MGSAIGCAGHWHSDETQTEKQWAEKLDLPAAGKVTIMAGSFCRGGRVFLVSSARRLSEELTEVFCQDLAGRIHTFQVDRQSSAVFSDSLSLAW